MTSMPAVTIYGAYGHTGRFVVAEMHRRGWVPVLSGRDVDKLSTLAASYPGFEVRPASLEDPASVDAALDGSAAVINCAGPFAFTQAPVIEAALRAGVDYLDMVAEPEIAAAAFGYDDRARGAGIVIAPALAFYGGLGDLLATAAMADWDRADEIQLAYALSSWKPTLGTRATIEAAKVRRGGGRLVFADNQLGLRHDESRVGEWTFPEPIGTQQVAEEFTTADSVTLSQHLTVATIRECMTLAPLGDLSDPDPTGPVAVDDRGRSAQTFLIEAVIHRGDQERRAIVRGQDIYAVSGPIVVEAAQRIVADRTAAPGTIPPGAITDARDFLTSLSPDHLTVEILPTLG